MGQILKATVHVVDDDADLRRLVEVFVLSAGFQFVGYENGASFLESYCADQPGCLLLDALMPQQSGLAVQQHLARLSYAPPVVMISGAADVALVVDTMKKGAIDFLCKPFTRSRLLSSVEDALQVDFHRRKRRHQQLQTGQYLQRLTPKELDVLRLLLKGMVNKQIAKELQVSIRTAELRRASILRKMEVDSLAELMRALLGPSPFESLYQPPIHPLQSLACSGDRPQLVG